MAVIFEMRKIQKVNHPPPGWVTFDAAQQVWDLTEGREAGMRAVFFRLRHGWHYITDQVKHAKLDHWEADPSKVYRNKAGDCEEFAIACRYGMLREYAPPESLHFATCFTENGRAHAVLLIDTSKGVWAMDVRRDAPAPWQDLPYRGWLVQFGGEWWRVRDPNPIVADTDNQGDRDDGNEPPVSG